MHPLHQQALQEQAGILQTLAGQQPPEGGSFHSVKYILYVLTVLYNVILFPKLASLQDTGTFSRKTKVKRSQTNYVAVDKYV